MNKEELNKILFSLEDVARKHTIEVCDNGSMIEFMSAQIDELRLNNYSAKILLNYINKQKEVLDKIKDKLKEDNKEAVDFTHKIETSDLQQGSYPVHYYRMLWNKELTEKYLEILEEIE